MSCRFRSCRFTVPAATQLNQPGGIRVLNVWGVAGRGQPVASLSPNGNFLARPLPANGTDFPLVHSTFYAPGAPRAAWGGLRLRF